MKKILFALPLIAALAACETRNGTIATSAAAGALAGAALDDDGNRSQGAAAGALLGAGAGALISRQGYGNCTYQRADGSRYTAACP